MKKLLTIGFLLCLLQSCKFQSNETLSVTSPEFPKVHYASVEHKVGAPVALLFSNGIYSLFYQDFDSSKKEAFVFYRTTSKDLIHWGKAEKVVFANDNQSVLYAALVQDSTLITKPNSSYLAILLTPAAEFKISRSDDSGKTWRITSDKVLFPEVVKKEFKPAIIRDHRSGKWIMSLVSDQKVKFYSSQDLKRWKYESAFEKEPKFRNNIWHKATLLPIGNGKSWSLLVDQEFEDPREGSAVQYFIGSFDGKAFHNQSSKPHWLDYGKDNVFNTLCFKSATDTLPVIIGWKNNLDYPLLGDLKTLQGSMTFPRTVSSTSVYGEILLACNPVQSLGDITKTGTQLRDITLEDSVDFSNKVMIPITPSLITLKFETTSMTRLSFPAKFGIRLGNDKGEKLEVGFDRFREWYYIDRSDFENVKQSPQFGGTQVMQCWHTDTTMIMKMIVDDSSVELFTENGKLVMTQNYSTKNKLNKLSLFAENGVIKVSEVEIKSLTSIWNK